jgi:glycosyltransferase involved in cell wall biosynthesis
LAIPQEVGLSALRVIQFSPSLFGGGAERIVIELLNGLPPYEVGQALALLYPLDTAGSFYLPQLKDPPPPIFHLDKAPGKWTRIPTTWRYWQMLRAFQPHIIHAHQWHPAQVARAYKRLWPQVRVVFSVQNSLLPRDVASEQRWWRGADAIVAASPHVAQQYIAAIPQSAERVVTIPNAVDTASFRPADSSTARKAHFPSLPQNMIIGLMVGRLAPEKNHQGLLQAVNQLVATGAWPANTLLICVGAGDGSAYEQQVRDYWHSAQLGPYVQFWPATPHIIPLYQACDFAILPSLHEALPRVALEAMACARPMLISEAANAGGVVQDGVQGWAMPSQDPQTIAQYLRQVVALPSAQRAQMGQAGRRHVEQHFGLEPMLQAYQQVYRTLVGR